jgi:hypothetical protein
MEGLQGHGKVTDVLTTQVGDGFVKKRILEGEGKLWKDCRERGR